MNKPDCYKCKFRGTLPWDAHSKCNNAEARVVGNEHGIKNGWFFHPVNFDPTWLEECDGFQPKEEVRNETESKQKQQS